MNKPFRVEYPNRLASLWVWHAQDKEWFIPRHGCGYWNDTDYDHITHYCYSVDCPDINPEETVK